MSENGGFSPIKIWRENFMEYTSTIYPINMRNELNKKIGIEKTTKGKV